MPDAAPVPASVVVVGAGLAGASTVAALRSQGYRGRVCVVGAEDVEPYDRPPLSKQLLSRTTPVPLREEVGADVRLADDVRLGTAATALTLEADSVVVHFSGGQVRAGAAVLATGSVPVVPPGWESARTLHTHADAAALRASLVPGRRLVVVGAGWIGAEVAGVAAAAGVHVTVVEAAPTPLAAALGPAVGALTARWYADAGVDLLTGRTVADVAADGVRLVDGASVAADVVLVAIGARPASGWLAGALPLEPDGSVVVDDAFRAAVPDAPGGPGVPGPPRPPVVVVGDLARRRSARHGWVPGGHWDGALRAPAVAVRRLLGGAPEPGDDLLPYVFSTQLGHELALLGQPGPADDVVVRGEPDDGAFTALWFGAGDDRLTAVLAVDRPRDVVAARRLLSGPSLPALDRALAADPEVPLRSAAR